MESPITLCTYLVFIHAHLHIFSVQSSLGSKYFDSSPAQHLTSQSLFGSSLRNGKRLVGTCQRDGRHSTLRKYITPLMGSHQIHKAGFIAIRLPFEGMQDPGFKHHDEKPRHIESKKD